MSSGKEINGVWISRTVLRRGHGTVANGNNIYRIVDQ